MREEFGLRSIMAFYRGFFGLNQVSQWANVTFLWAWAPNTEKGALFIPRLLRILGWGPW